MKLFNHQIKSLHVKVITGFLIVLVSSLKAQVPIDSAKSIIEKKIAIYFPTNRFIDVQYEQFLKANYHSDLYKEPFEKGSLNKQYRLKMAMNIPLISHERWNLRLALRYKMESFEFANVENQPIDGAPVYHSDNEKFYFFSAGLQYSYYLKLAGKTTMVRAIVLTEGSEGGFERVNFTLTGNMVVKKTERTAFALGLLLQSSNTAIFPIMPVLTFEHKFANSSWQAEVVLPRYAYLRKPITDKNWITLGTSFDSESFYVYPQNQPGLQKVYQFNRNEIKTGFNYEHMIATVLILSFRGGINTTLPASFRVRGATDKIMSVTQNPNVYFNVGISYIPIKKK